MPSEFKEKWNEMVTEQILDAFPDFVDKFYLLVPLIHELFLTIRETIQNKQKCLISKIAENLNLMEGDNSQQNEQISNMLNSKLQVVF